MKEFKTKQEILKEIERLQKELVENYKNFESVIILSENVSFKDYKKAIEESKEILQDVTEVEELGIKRLAYEIKGNKEGVYVRFVWTGNGQTLSDIEKYFKNNDNIIKFLSMRTDYED